MADVVEELGLGPAQLRSVAFAGAVPFSMGCQLSALSLITASAAAEFNLSERQLSIWMAVVYLGMLVGGLSGGWIADSLGRRRTIIASVLATPAFGLVSTLSPCWPLLLLCWLLLGLSMGLGFPASVTLVNELSPKAWKTTTRASCEVLFDLGFIVSAGVGMWQDPVLFDLRWRSLVAWASIPCALLGSLGFLLHHDSPPSLAARGFGPEARKALETALRLNGLEDEGHCLELRNEPEVEVRSSGVWSGRVFKVTTSLAFAAFFLSVSQYAGMYFLSQVQSQGSHDLVGSMQMIGGGVIDILALATSAWFSRHMPRPVALEAALVSAAITVWCYSVGSGGATNNMLAALVHQLGVVGFYWVPALGFLSLYQAAAEAFPTHLAATGVGAAFAAGRLGAILVPDLLSRCEAFSGGMSFFCYSAGFACLVGAALVHVVLFQTGSANALEESKPLLPSAWQSKAVDA